MLPYFRKLEHNVRGASEWHGTDGPLWASDIVAKHELVEALIAAGGELGIPAQRRFQRRDAGRRRLLPADDAPRLPLLDGDRLPASRARGAAICASRPARRRRGSCSRAGARSRRRLSPRRPRRHRDGAARGDRRRRRTAVAAAAAAVRRRAGRRCCSDYGIPVVHELPGVGENLQDHLQARVIFRCTKPITTNDVLKSWWRTLAMGMRYVLTRTGPMAIGINQGGMFARTDPALDRPDVQFHLATLSSDMAGSPVHTFSGFTLSVCQLRPQSRGHVRIKSPDPLAAPAMQPNYLSTPHDRATIVARHPARAEARRDARARALRRRRIPARPGRDDRRAISRIRARQGRARSSIRPAPARWDRRPIRSRSSTPSSASTASTESASSIAASCRRSCPATPMRRSS